MADKISSRQLSDRQTHLGKFLIHSMHNCTSFISGNESRKSCWCAYFVHRTLPKSPILTTHSTASGLGSSALSRLSSYYYFILWLRVTHWTRNRNYVRFFAPSLSSNLAPPSLPLPHSDLSPKVYFKLVKFILHERNMSVLDSSKCAPPTAHSLVPLPLRFSLMFNFLLLLFIPFYWIKSKPSPSVKLGAFPILINSLQLESTHLKPCHVRTSQIWPPSSSSFLLIVGLLSFSPAAARVLLEAHEKRAYAWLYSVADADKDGYVSAAEAVGFFSKSGLPREQLVRLLLLPLLSSSSELLMFHYPNPLHFLTLPPSGPDLARGQSNPSLQTQCQCLHSCRPPHCLGSKWPCCDG